MADTRLSDSCLLDELHSFPKDIHLPPVKKREIQVNIMNQIEQPEHKKIWKKAIISFTGFVAICILSLLTMTFINSDHSQLMDNKKQAKVQIDSHFSKDDVVESLKSQGVLVAQRQIPNFKYYTLLGQAPASYHLGNGHEHIQIYTFKTPEEARKATEQFKKQPKTINYVVNFFTVKNLLLLYVWKSDEREYTTAILKTINQLEPLAITPDIALEKVLDKNPDFPKFKMGQQVDVTDIPVGGPEGTTTTITYSAQVIGNKADGYVVTLTKDWHLNVNGTKVISTFTWAVTAENITLLHVTDNDDVEMK